MASGETLVRFVPQCNEPPQTAFATLDLRNYHPVLDFTLNEIAIFSSILPRNYSGLGLTVYLHYSMDGVIVNDIKLETYFERIGNSIQDLDSDGFAAAQDTGDIVIPGVSGHVDIISTIHTDGAQIDSLTVGEGFRLKVKRIAVAGLDAAGDLELRFIEIKET